MSRIGKLPISIPEGVTVSIDNASIKVAGPKGSLTHTLPQGIEVSLEGDKAVVSIVSQQKKQGALFGLTRSIVSNMVTGVSKGFEKNLELVGIGYRTELKGKCLHFTLGYSHPIRFELPEGITAKVDKQSLITLEGADKKLLGETAATIRGFKKPEPYKGKGIKYTNETIKRKIGKKGIK